MERIFKLVNKVCIVDEDFFGLKIRGATFCTIEVNDSLSGVVRKSYPSCEDRNHFKKIRL
jgi:hypothetical protein